MKKALIAIVVAGLVCLGGSAGFLISKTGSVSVYVSRGSDHVMRTAASDSRTDVDYGEIPLYFVPNRGQAHPEALYRAASSGFTLWLTARGLAFDLIRESAGAGGEDAIERSLSRMVFPGARPNPILKAVEASSHRVSYIRGQDPSAWITDIPTSRAVLYENLYGQVDLKIYGKGRQVEYDWIVRPGGNASDIEFRYENVDTSRLSESGNLEVETDFGTLVHTRPRCFQAIGGAEVEVAARFAVRDDGGFGFEVAPHDPRYPLVIDPVVLVYSTYLGGTSNEAGNGIAVDAAGAAYVAGFSASSDFPVKNPFQKLLKKDMDVVVTKINPKGDALVYSTFIGGSANDWATDIAVDKRGCAYVTGATDSADYPVKKPFQGKRKGTRDIVVTKLNAAGNGLVYSTYLGGAQWESGEAIAVDAKGAAYVTGNTISSDFPLKNPFQKYMKPSFPQLAYVTKLHSSGNALVYSTYLGGSKGSMGRGICVDGQGSAFVTGDTYSDDFPVKNPVQAARAGYEDAFATKLNPQGNRLVFSTYYGGSTREIGYGIAVAGNGTVYLTGYTDSSNLPTVKPLQPGPGGLNDVYVAKLNAAGSALLYSTYLGGSSYDYGSDLALDKDGNAYVVGRTYSSNFPVKQAFQKSLKGAYSGFVSKLNAGGSALLYSTYLGGSIETQGNDIAVGADRTAYVTGQTYALDFPLKNPIQPQKKGALEAFVAKIK